MLELNHGHLGCEDVFLFRFPWIEHVLQSYQKPKNKHLSEENNWEGSLSDCSPTPSFSSYDLVVFCSLIRSLYTACLVEFLRCA